MTLLAMYRPRTPMRTLGSSKGMRFDTCIIPRMMTRLVLQPVSANALHETSGPNGPRLEVPSSSPANAKPRDCFGDAPTQEGRGGGGNIARARNPQSRYQLTFGG